MWDRETERQKAYDFVVQSMTMQTDLTKQEKIEKAIGIAKEELVEVDEKLASFLESVNHLHVFKELLEKPFIQYITQMKQQANYMLEKNYSKEELDQMPESVFNQVTEVQKKRVEILKKIAKTYFV
jgi:hypothetical protein